MAAKKKTPPKNPAPPKMPELPPGYNVVKCSIGDWLVYVNDDLIDGIKRQTSRPAAVRAAWDVFFTYGCTREWVAFFKAHGAPV